MKFIPRLLAAGALACAPPPALAQTIGAATSGTPALSTSTAVSGLVAKIGGGNLYGFTGYSSAPGWFLLFDAAVCPADGAVAPIEFIRYPAADQTVAYAANPPLTFQNGLSICFSASGPYAKTANATATLSAKVK